MRTKVIYGASPCVELENCIPAFHHQFARLLCIFQQTNRQQPKAAQYKMLLCIKVKSKCVTLAVRSWKLGSGMVFWGAFSGFSGVLGALCLFRLRGSRQNKVKCFIYGLCVCVCVCLSVGVASVICVVATRQTVRRIQAAGRIVNPGSWILLSCRLRFWLSAALQMNNFNKCRAPSPLPFPFPLPEIVTT